MAIRRPTESSPNAFRSTSMHHKPQHIDSKKLHLLCVPHAGGSATLTYARWAPQMPVSVKLIPLELSGRGRRAAEPLQSSLEAMVADLMSIVGPIAKTAPYAFYGHSMGACIVYELVCVLAAANLPPPQALFLSGCLPPHRHYPQRNLHRLTDDLFLAEIRDLGGTPDEFFAHKELINAFLPVLRSDYRNIECYRAKLPIHVTSADIVFLFSDQDPLVDKPGIYEWQHYTHGLLNVVDFTGGHFFINNHWIDICRLLGSELGRLAVQ